MLEGMLVMNHLGPTISRTNRMRYTPLHISVDTFEKEEDELNVSEVLQKIIITVAVDVALFRWVHPSLYKGVSVRRMDGWSVGWMVRRMVTCYFF